MFHKLTKKKDIVLLKSADSTMYVSKEVFVVIYSNGLVSYVPPGVYSVSCPIDLTQFPL